VSPLAATSARVLTVRAAVVATSGDTDGALPLYRDVLRRWAGFGYPWEEAWVGLDMAVLLDPRLPAVRAAADRSRELFERMKAVPILELLDEALARTSTRTQLTSAPRTASPAAGLVRTP